MADAWQVPARLALFVGCRHSVGPFVYFKGVRAHSRQGRAHRRGFYQMRHTFGSRLSSTPVRP